MYLSMLTATILSLALLDCPATPNCVSSQATDPARWIEPLAYPPGRDQLALRALLQVLQDLPRTEITEQSDTLVKAVVQSALFRFKDDLEFHFDSDASVIHIRSASRTGYWDLGMNRRRLRRIGTAFEQKINPHFNTPASLTSGVRCQNNINPSNPLSL